MIIQPSEVSTYAPSVTLTGAALSSALYYAEAIATGPQGSNRRLDLSERVEVLRQNNSFTGHLCHWPIKIGISYPITIEVRQFAQARDFGVEPWTAIAPESYTVEDNGAYTIDAEKIGVLFQGFGRSNYRTTHRPHARNSRFEARIKYWAGFDFVTPINLDTVSAEERDVAEKTLQIKAALGGILELYAQSKGAIASLAAVSNGAGNTGAVAPEIVSKMDVKDEVSVEYEGGSDLSKRVDGLSKVGISSALNNNQMDAYLFIFQDFKARKYPI